MVRLIVCVIGTSVVAAALIAVLAVIMWTGLFGIFIALALLAGIGALWSRADERRLEAKYREDMKCS